MASDKKAEWLEAAWSEWESLLSNGAFKFTPRSNLEPRVLVIKCKWDFRVKRNEHDEIERYKARLVAKDHQKYGINFKETVAPVAKYMSIRLLEAIKTIESLTCEQTFNTIGSEGCWILEGWRCTSWVRRIRLRTFSRSLCRRRSLRGLGVSLG